MIIRRLSIGELGVVTELAHVIWPPTFKDILSPEQLTYMLNWMYSEGTLREQLDNGHEFFVMEISGRPVGFMGIEAHYPQKQYLKVHKLYVLPETQGSGAGRKFIDKAVELAKEKGISVLTLNVNRFNKAVDFYFRMGFKVEKEEDIDIGNEYLMEDYVMSLPVTR